jgi:hypothetical protein
MAQPDTHKLAEKIAKILESGSQNTPDLAALFASVEKINHRLEKLEKAIASNPRSQIPKSPHPSQEKFSVAEAIADEIFSNYKKEKARQAL